ncbi:MAG: polysaccharide biosynthesis tyrosine autokinase [Candidatus Azobacteroides sp.]|nr:polysaccharide biosynthesis tyrosine autokinase [Candidatus Azobacteroides sp.]
MQDTNNLINPNSEQENEISLIEIVLRYVKYWKYFVISVVLCVLLAFIYLQYSVSQYKVMSSIVVRDGKKGPSNVEMTAFNDLGIISQNGNLDNEIEVLKSRTLAKNVADSLKINVNYYKDGIFKKREIYKKSPVWINVNEFKKTGNLIIDKIEDNSFIVTSKDTTFTKKIFLGEAFESPWGLLTINKNETGSENFPIIISIIDPDSPPRVTVDPLNKTSNVVELSIVLANAEKGKDIVNALVDIYNQQVIEDKNFVATNTIRFIDDRLVTIAKELESAEKNVETYKKERNITDLQTEGNLLLTANTEYSQKISDVDVQINILSSIKDFVYKNANTILPTNVGITDPTVIGLIGTYNELLLDKKRTTGGMKAENPILQEYDDRIASLKENLLKGIGIEDARLKSVRAELIKQESLYSSKIRGLSTQERESRELYRQKEIKETLFVYLLQKREETGLSLVLATPNAKVIDKAYADKSPVKPKRKIILLAAFLLGLIIPICVIYLIDLFKFKLENKEELISVVKAPFLGEIPFNKGEDLFPVKEVRSRVAEKFRIVAANLSFLLGEENSKVISITSTVPSEGKSFFARNLALSLATSGNKTLLIDADMRKSKLNGLVDFHVDKGFARYLADPDIQIDDIIEKAGDWNKNLHVIPTKVFPPNPAELLASKRLDDLFAKVKVEYDYVIVDTPPIGLVADVFRLNQFANASVYVTRMNYTHKASLKDIKELYDDKKLHNMSCIINGVPKSKRYGYGDSGYYHEGK